MVESRDLNNDLHEENGLAMFEFGEVYEENQGVHGRRIVGFGSTESRI